MAVTLGRNLPLKVPTAPAQMANEEATLRIESLNEPLKPAAPPCRPEHPFRGHTV